MGVTTIRRTASTPSCSRAPISWNFKAKGMPPREVLAQYKLLVWHADDVPVCNPHKISTPTISRYSPTTSGSAGSS